jgi:hypothetical protein
VMSLIRTRLQSADRDLGGSAHPRPETEEQRRVADVAQGKTGDADILQDAAIDGLERKTAAALENAVADRDVAEPAIRLGAAFDPAGALPAMRVGACPCQRTGSTSPGHALAVASLLAVRSVRVSSSLWFGGGAVRESPSFGEGVGLLVLHHD